MTHKPHSLEFFFDCSSPWTYFAFTGVIPIAKRLGVTIDWRPILVGGVFNAVNKDLYGAREAMFKNERRITHYFKDMEDWARFYNVAVSQPPVFPVNSVKAMRGVFHADERGLLVPYAKRVFEAYWGEHKDISQDDVLCSLCDDVGLKPSDFMNAVGEQACKDRLRANTEELVERGGYGSPTMFIDGDDMYFGNDRLPLVELALQY